MLLDKCIEYLKWRTEIANAPIPDPFYNQKVEIANNRWNELCDYCSDNVNIDDIKDNLDIYIGFQDYKTYNEEQYDMYGRRLMKMMELIENGLG